MAAPLGAFFATAGTALQDLLWIIDAQQARIAEKDARIAELELAAARARRAARYADA